MKIPLFDIDSTLVKSKPGRNIHNEAFRYAFETVFGIEATINEIVAHGMIDPQIIMKIMTLHNLNEKTVETKMPQALEAMVTYFKKHYQENAFYRLPFTKELLESLKERNVPRGILSGNLEEIAWLKLEQAGLKDLLQFGAFGNMARKREDLIAIAHQQALKIGLDTKDFIIIGDSLLDIACAKSGGIKSIGVATGAYSIAELAKAGADLVIENFKDSTKVIDFLLEND